MGFEGTGEGFFLCHPLFGPKFVFEKRQLLAVFVGQRVPLREADVGDDGLNAAAFAGDGDDVFLKQGRLHDFDAVGVPSLEIGDDGAKGGVHVCLLLRATCSLQAKL